MKGVRSKILISLVCVFAGFMIAIQFQSTQEPSERDTRDLWEIRNQLQKEQKIQQKLYKQINESEKLIEEYHAKSEQEQLNALKESTEKLKQKAGLTEKTGKGLYLYIKPVFQDVDYEQTYPTITPELLNRLLNELNTYGATDIAIENERIINLTSIRYVNGETYVNNHALPGVPPEIKVLAQDPERLLDYIQVSKSRDYFAIENLELSGEIDQAITLPKYEGIINLQGLEVNE